MILYQNDYIVVDVSWHSYWTISDEEVWQTPLKELIFDLTIQCNWRIRRNRFTAQLTHDDKLASNMSVDWRDVSNYRLIYSPFELLKDLWYDVPTWVDLHPMIRDALTNCI